MGPGCVLGEIIPGGGGERGGQGTEKEERQGKGC